MSTPAKSYKETLNLPVTRFDMKANLGVREPQMQQRWAEQDLYGQIRRSRAGKPRRVLHDGPPYANGDIHMGHLLNKVLKDAVARYLTLRGFDSPYVPGWDCHGLPIEHTVMKTLGSQASTLSASEIREKCRVEALKWVDIQRSQFQRLGILGDWANPYLTLNPGYEASILAVLADLAEGGFLTRQLKPIHWCINDRTALAEAELEYHDAESPSIYVNFPLLNGTPAAWGEGDWHLMVWTTTPWTLPANVAIAAHPDVAYAGIRYTDPTTNRAVQTVVAADLAEKVLGLRKITQWEEVGRCTGRDLEHGQYRHPFLERTGPVVLADYVTVEDGTGLVHTAPGHGAEDYRTGLSYGLDTLSPVDAGGRFSDEAPDWLVGKNVFAANPVIVDHLRGSGLLFHTFSFDHSYPHCWRCKKPVIFRATAQWFVAVDHTDLRGRTLRVIEEHVRWLPGWGKSRIAAMVSNRPDWCISRQRAWGVPIPSLYDERTGDHHLTAESIRFHSELFRREGANAWYDRPVAELAPPDLDPQRFPLDHLRKGTDILDVWFESGSSHRAVLTENFQLGYPAYMYLEGSDQHRGWFQSSILTAVASTGRAPFETVLTHGFVVDDKGAKMSKSIGNVIHAVKATEQYGADVLRLYVLSMDYSDDVRMSERGIKEASDAYRKLRNTFRFLLGNLGDYRDLAFTQASDSDLLEIDRWMLGQLNTLVRDCTDALDRYEFYKAFQRIYQFASITLSSVYLDVLKDRLYADNPSSPSRLAALRVLARLVHDLAILLSPYMPHTTEEVWDYIPADLRETSSVHLAGWPEPNPEWDNAERTETFERLLALREEAFVVIEGLRKSKVVGGSQEAQITVRTNDEEAAWLEARRELFPTLCGISGLEIHVDAALPRAIIADRSVYPKCERCWNLRPSVGADANRPTLCERCAEVVAGQG